MPNQPSDHNEKERPESKAEQAEQRAAKSIMRQESPEDRQALVDRQTEAAEKDKSIRAMTPEAAATLANAARKSLDQRHLRLGSVPSWRRRRRMDRNL